MILPPPPPPPPTPSPGEAACEAQLRITADALRIAKEAIADERHESRTLSATIDGLRSDLQTATADNDRQSDEIARLIGVVGNAARVADQLATDLNKARE